MICFDRRELGKLEDDFNRVVREEGRPFREGVNEQLGEVRILLRQLSRTIKSTRDCVAIVEGKCAILAGRLDALSQQLAVSASAGLLDLSAVLGECMEESARRGYHKRDIVIVIEQRQYSIT